MKFLIILNSVVVLELNEDPVADFSRLLQPAYAFETLRVFDAELMGEGLRFGPGKTRDAHILGFFNPDQAIEWATRLNEAASFDVEISYDAAAEANGNTFKVNFSSQTLTGRVKPGNIQTVYLGE
jgi:hypothetical protein